MTAYMHDGNEFDLDRTFVDVVGVEWRWTGGWNAAGEPLMQGAALNTPVPLPDVYRDHGPLIAIAARPSTAECVAAIDPNFAKSEADGFVESLADYELRMGGAR